MDRDRDVEASPSPSPQPSEKVTHVETSRAGTTWNNLVDSFKRNPNARVTTEAIDAEGRPLPHQPPAEPALAMKLKNRHLQMIAIGGSIGKNFKCREEGCRLTSAGTGLFVGSGSSLATGGPASLILVSTCQTKYLTRVLMDGTGIRTGRYNAVLHSPCSWRASCGLPHCRIILRVLKQISGSRLGFRNGLEVSTLIPDYHPYGV